MTTPTITSTRAALPPLLFLDIDGVIAPSGGQPSYPGPVRWANLFPGRMHFPAAVLDRLCAWHAIGAVRVQWLTSWENEAATTLAPALGLPDWPVHTRRTAPRWHEVPYDDDNWWKQRVVLAALEAGERAIWCDDDIAYRADQDLLTRLYGHRLLAISPNSATGLTAADLNTIEAWATRPGPQGTAADPALAILDEIAFIDG